MRFFAIVVALLFLMMPVGWCRGHGHGHGRGRPEYNFGSIPMGVTYIVGFPPPTEPGPGFTRPARHGETPNAVEPRPYSEVLPDFFHPLEQYVRYALIDGESQDDNVESAARESTEGIRDRDISASADDTVDVHIGAPAPETAAAQSAAPPSGTAATSPTPTRFRYTSVRIPAGSPSTLMNTETWIRRQVHTPPT